MTTSANDTASSIRVLGISGSLRKGSFNSALLGTAIELAKSSVRGVVIERAEIGDLPLYDDDVRAAGWPPPVERFRTQVANADAILIATPEYNYSIPGVLKNAIDWASRPPSQPFAGKPLAIMGASGGASGTMRGQYHLRQVAVFLDMHVLNRPEIFVARAAEKIDAEGRITDDALRKLIGTQLEALRDFTLRWQRGSVPPV